MTQHRLLANQANQQRDDDTTPIARARAAGDIPEDLYRPRLECKGVYPDPVGRGILAGRLRRMRSRTWTATANTKAAPRMSGATKTCVTADVPSGQYVFSIDDTRE